MKILFTGFEPFGDWSINPTEEAVKKLNGLKVGFNNEIEVVGEVIPLRYHEIKSKVDEIVTKNNPTAILFSGQAGGDSLRLERIAHNIVRCAIPYNCGTLIDEPKELILDAPAELQSTLPLDLIYRNMIKNNIPVIYSESAGTFGCNQIMYYGRFYYSEIPNGFIHVPLLPSQKKEDQPCLEQEKITTGLKIALETVGNWLSEKNSIQLQQY